MNVCKTDLTVTICTYNGESKLPIVLERLRSQVSPESFGWEVLVVDNNSSDRTAQVVAHYQKNWPNSVPLRYAFEAEQGLAFARRCAIKVARGELIGFLDDDNLPAEDWVRSVYLFGQRHPEAGAYGGRIRSQFETAPPPNFERIASCLALIDRGEEAFPYADNRGVLPAGAGMVIRSAVWRQCVPEIPLLAGVCGNSLSAKGEDVETLSYIRKAGYPIWYAPQMVIWHDVPKERFSRDYLFRLFRGIGLSRYPLRMVNYKPWQRPGMSLAHFCYDVNRLLLYSLERWSEIRRNEVVAMCELRLHLYSLLSGMYAVHIRLSRHFRSESGSELKISFLVPSAVLLSMK